MGEQEQRWAELRRLADALSAGLPPGGPTGVDLGLAALDVLALLDERDELEIAIHGGCGCPAPYDQCPHQEPLLPALNAARKRLNELENNPLAPPPAPVDGGTPKTEGRWGDPIDAAYEMGLAAAREDRIVLTESKRREARDLLAEVAGDHNAADAAIAALHRAGFEVVDADAVWFAPSTGSANGGHSCENTPTCAACLRCPAPPAAPVPPKPEDYEHNGRIVTHYLNHGNTWQGMDGGPIPGAPVPLEADERPTPNAPRWVHSVTPDEIVAQRGAGWPDFHPEDFCHRCGRRNPIWWCALDVWSVVFPDHAGIACPSCFAGSYTEVHPRATFELTVTKDPARPPEADERRGWDATVEHYPATKSLAGIDPAPEGWVWTLLDPSSTVVLAAEQRTDPTEILSHIAAALNDAAPPASSPSVDAQLLAGYIVGLDDPSGPAYETAQRVLAAAPVEQERAGRKTVVLAPETVSLLAELLPWQIIDRHLGLGAAVDLHDACRLAAAPRGEA